METKHIQTQKELNDRIEDFEYIEDGLLHRGAHRMNSGEAYAHDDGSFPLYPERWLAEIEDFAAKFPPADIVEFDYQNLADQPYHFQQYGLRIDNLNRTLYLAYLAYFADWYRRSRNTIVLQQDEKDPWSQPSWEAVDKMVSKIPRLAGIKPEPAAIVREPAPPILTEPLTAEQLAARTLSDVRRTGEDFYGI